LENNDRFFRHGVTPSVLVFGDLESLFSPVPKSGAVL
jgi:hypothetical protein